MRAHRLTTLLVVCLGLGAVGAARAQAQAITSAGQPAQLDVRAAGERSVRITLKPISVKEDFPVNPAIADRKYPPPALSLRELAASKPIRKKIGALMIEVRTNPDDAARSPTERGANPPIAEASAADQARSRSDAGPSAGDQAGSRSDAGAWGQRPYKEERPPSLGEGGSGGMGKTLTLRITNDAGKLIQAITFEEDGNLSFALDDQPVLGLGEGGPQPEKGKPWREDPVQFDRRGQLDTMQPRWQAGMYGSRNPVAMMLGTSGWGLFVAAPWGQVDLREAGRGVFLPWRPTDADRVPQDQRNQQQALAKGLPPPEATIPGVYDLFVFDASDPAAALKDFSVITGPAAMPPLWALGYMQSHRTLEDDTQLLDIADTFRKKQIPLDALIYLGTGFTPRGWNTKQPSFDFNPEVFKQRDGPAVVSDLHAKHTKVVVHMVPWDRDKLPTLHGTIPARAGETLDDSHIANYWQQHVPLVKAGIDAFWPDEGDWFNLHERIKRHQLYYQGHLSTTPNVRPWSLQRNGYPGIAQWGGWVWSGDTDSSWKTLEAQIAVGLNYSLSIGPYWGSDIGGFYANNELTGELYARWFQFAAFCGSFRSHGRTWWTRLPWGWGLDDMGPREYNNTNTPIPADDRRNILQSEMNNPAIEPVVKKYAELRYQLLPYTYTLARGARDHGLPLMRAMWLHYPDDVRARGLGNQFLWGRDLLVAPIFTKGAASRAVYLPKGDWYDWWTNEKAAAGTEGGGRTVTRQVDLGTMPLFVRAGAIVPVDPVRQYTAQPVSEPTTLKIYSGADGNFTLYADDGISQEYVAGRGTWIRMTWNDRTKRLTLEPGAPKGATNVAMKRTFRAVLLPAGTSKEISYEGKRIELRF